jgi:hypothetical protein
MSNQENKKLFDDGIKGLDNFILLMETKLDELKLIRDHFLASQLENIRPPEEKKPKNWQSLPPTIPQIEKLKEFGIEPTKELTRGKAGNIIDILSQNPPKETRIIKEK